MSTFKPGDRVIVIAADPGNAATVGEFGTVIDDGSTSGGRIAVTGIDCPLLEEIRGYRTYTADQLRAVS
ncbi:hypothetical protein ACIQNU_04215 [Streptomyces sp. NPDC091292]|uniref:hypothetical protein n=1 Tax=Streptomyces sp. NPDC091292 TaxID=3365991 RepID=UPI003824933B